MIRLSPRAERDLDDLLAHYDAHDRPEAVRNLLAAVASAAARIERDPGAGLPAPRPYPRLAGYVRARATAPGQRNLARL